MVRRDDPQIQYRLALHIVSTEVIARGVEKIDWEDFPDIGENDWTRILARAEILAPPQTADMLSWALELLAERAASPNGE